MEKKEVGNEKIIFCLACAVGISSFAFLLSHHFSKKAD